MLMQQASLKKRVESNCMVYNRLGSSRLRQGNPKKDSRGESLAELQRTAEDRA